jgi:PKD repeat protein
VAFSAQGSADPDGQIVAYEWTFGDGSATLAGPTASHTYSTAGSYSAQLKVTDNVGLTGTKSVPITVNPLVVLVPMKVGDIAMSIGGNPNKQWRGVAAVKVLDVSTGLPIAGATVAGQWSGLVRGSASGVTGSAGVISLSSPGTRSRGTITFTVTGVTMAGAQYEPTANVETADSITR